MGRTRKWKQEVQYEERKKVDNEMEWCEACEVEIPKKKKFLDEHYGSKKNHQRKDKLYILHSFFLRHGLDYFPAGTTYFCQLCNIQLSNDVEALSYHIKKYSLMHEKHKLIKSIDFPTISKEVFIKKSLRLVDFENTNDALNAQLLKYERVNSPITLLESGYFKNHIFDLKTNVFTIEELGVVTKVVSHLEKNGNSISRSEAKGSSRLCMFGMRSAYRDTGWYIHNNTDCYNLSVDLARYVIKILMRTYATILQHLHNIPIIEGFQSEEVCIGEGPFTSFVVSRDFNCRPHRDHDDYDYGFIIWLEEDIIDAGIEACAIVFPEVERYFVPKHGDVICFKPSEFLHCTKRLDRQNLLGLAFFQKCSLYRQLGKLILPTSTGSISYENKEGVTVIVETKEGFLKKKEKYKEHVSAGALSITNFLGA